VSVEAPGSADGPGYVDLHAHSTASDGTLPPERVIEAAHRRGLVAIALTDHDTVDGLVAAKEAGERIGVRVVPGVELSAFEDDHEIHLLALHVTQSDALQARLGELREMRQRRARQIVARLNALGVAITIEEVLEQSAGGAVGRPHVARALIARGAVTDFKDAFAQYLGAGGSAFVPKDRLSIADAVGIAHEAGAIAVWAHPGEAGRRERLEPLLAAGLDGVEVRHPSHSREDMLRLKALADFFGILPSGGSDWHGSNDGPRRLGVMNVPREWLDRQDARVASLAASTP